MNKKTTLKLNKEFRRLYFKGSSAVHPLIVTYACKNRLGRNRIGITATKKDRQGGVPQPLQKNYPRGVFIRWNRRLGRVGILSLWQGQKTAQAKSSELVPVLKKQIMSLTKPDKEKKGICGKKEKGSNRLVKGKSGVCRRRVRQLYKKENKQTL